MFDFLKKEKIISFSKIKNLKLINNNNFIEKTLILLFKNKKNPIKNKNSDFKKNIYLFNLISIEQLILFNSISNQQQLIATKTKLQK